MSRVVVIGATGHVGGEPLPLPDLGLGVLHHVHADDVAQGFERALTRPAAIGSSFRDRDVLGYAPCHSSLDALHEAVRRLAANGHVDVDGYDF